MPVQPPESLLVSTTAAQVLDEKKAKKWKKDIHEIVNQMRQCTTEFALLFKQQQQTEQSDWKKLEKEKEAFFQKWKSFLDRYPSFRPASRYTEKEFDEMEKMIYLKQTLGKEDFARYKTSLLIEGATVRTPSGEQIKQEMLKRLEQQRQGEETR